MFDRDESNESAIPKFSASLPGQRKDGTPGAGGGRPFGPDPDGTGRVPRQGENPDR
ncbi:hypothetical protein OG618_37885 (plasmid) [Kitasatospora sp. NBC_01246]|uniref:hypothetical protein n=1 Tax=Kitasatospora sp. NBC_01246 TaxID=2903570 RepID=UPI002E3448BF|nr:hypothetical protein [Kitasatospora sp. NBC_01246]